MNNDTAVTNSYDAMKAELVAAGYKFGVYRDYIATPDNTHPLLASEWTYSITTPYAEVIEKAYAHLQQQKELVALRVKAEQYETALNHIARHGYETPISEFSKNAAQDLLRNVRQIAKQVLARYAKSG